MKLLHAVSPETKPFWPGIGGQEIPENTVGAVVSVYGTSPLNVVYEVEFVADDGETLGIVTLSGSDIQPLRPSA
ncbi:DUF4926 domain-containing protein [Nocardia sp. NPDC051750]|uniref:DUF4926 domain-containing protein n=1 Tax=Nocardia sp. NPDC051750 TaxID=3364325 RepID=UPI00379CCB40